jgi:cytochrome c oxidase assembly protein subunit 15
MMAQNPVSCKSVSRWLWLCAGMVFVMALVGAITRLTESGLSIAEWKPLIGALPPLSEQEWSRVFAVYQQTPQFHDVNADMTLEGFKKIFWWEWGHRLLGRLIGLVFAVPLLWFAVTRQVRGAQLVKLFFILALGGLQGGIGWFMVASGLIDRPSVSQYRLALHLLMAVLLMGLLVWQALAFSDTRRFPQAPPFVRTQAHFALGMVLITTCWGAFVAGLDAGLVYNEFPLMGGRFLPEDALHQSPWWLNFLENPVGVQFLHRWLAVATTLVVVFLAFELMRSPNLTRRAGSLGKALLGVVLLQLGLGIATLLTQVNIILATTHQAGALLLTGLLVVVIYELKGRA